VREVKFNAFDEVISNVLTDEKDKLIVLFIVVLIKLKVPKYNI